MIVSNNTQFVICTPIYPTKMIGIYNKTVRLMPGKNQVDDSDWTEMQKVQAIKTYMEEKNLQELDGRPLSERSEKEAIAIVKDTHDHELLAKWREDDSRAGVRKAIAKQLGEITPTKEELEKAKR